MKLKFHYHENFTVDYQSFIILRYFKLLIVCFYTYCIELFIIYRESEFALFRRLL